jgi:hypothetical protein
MVMPGESNALGGLALLLGGSLWFGFGVPRVVGPVARPFVGVTLASLGSLLLPVLYPLVLGIWLLATPSKLTPWFTVAWAACWAVCLAGAAVLACPLCGQSFNRSGALLRTAPLSCAHCGASSESGSAP